VGTVRTGLTAAASMDVGEGDTAMSMGSGDVPVLATGRVIALCEEATCALVAGRLADGETSVAARVEVAHLAPVGVGAHVTAEATLERAEGRRLTFTVSVTDDNGLVAAGKITRVVVDRDEFLRRVP
jgi:fluoroacetyl-CoA thioesterase